MPESAPQQPARDLDTKAQAHDQQLAEVGAAARTPPTAAPPPGQRRPIDLLALQRSVGNQATQREIRRSAAQRGQQQRQRPAVQRVPAPNTRIIQPTRTALTTKEILAALKSVPFIRGKLAKTLNEETMEAHIAKVLRSYKAHFAKKTNPDLNTRDAMMLSMALDGVARIIAEEINDPSVQGEVATKLMELYRAEIGNGIKNQKRSLKNNNDARNAVLDLAATLLSGDPVTQYMHREIGLPAAAQQIRTMAEEAEMEPEAMFELMEQRFQAQLSTFEQSQLQQDDQTARFSTRESYGEYSTYFFQQMFGDDAFTDEGSPDWEAGGQGEEDRLKFTDDAEAKLAELRAEVKKDPAVGGAVVPRAGVTEGQERHLAGLEAAEARINRDDIKANFVNFFMERYFITKPEAETLYTDVGTLLRTTPITITVKAQDWFGGARDPNPEFKPAAARKAQTPLKTIFGKDVPGVIEHLPTWDDSRLPEAEKRGPKYLRFRVWKDQLMTGLNELESTEMPVFGALNVNWETTRGGDTPDTPGSNYYGNLHYLLKRANVANRLIYTATDHGQPRRDPLLTLNDFTFGGRGLTWLKETKKLEVIDNVVNAARTQQPVYGLPLLFEVQIFGGINIETDVAEVYLGSDVTAELKRKVEDFYDGTGVTITQITAAPPGAVKIDGGGIQSLDLAQMLMAESLTDEHTAAVDTAASSRSTTGGELQGFQKGMIKVAYTIGYYIRDSIDAFQGAMTEADIAQYRRALAKLEGLNNTVRAQPQIPATVKDPLAAIVLAARTQVGDLRVAPPPRRDAPQPVVAPGPVVT